MDNMKFREIVGSMQIGFCLIQLVFDQHGTPVDYRFLEANAAFELQSGLSDVVGKTILQLVPDFETEWFAVYRRVLESGAPIRFESEFKSLQSWFEVDVARLADTDQLVIFFKDITQSKTIASELNASTLRLTESEENFRSMFESIDEGFCVVEVAFDSLGAPVDYTFLQVNPAFERLTGLLAPAGRSVHELVPDIEGAWIAKIGGAVVSGRPARFINPVAALEKTFNVYACRVGGAESKRAAIVFTDITAAKLANDDLRRTAAELSESDRKKNEFLATLAHELRNPLAPLTNGLHLLRHLKQDPAATARILELMDRQVKQMVHLVNDLLDISRISTGKIDLRSQTVDLQTVLAMALETGEHLFVQRQQRFTSQIVPGPILLQCDSTRISQVIGNLLNNASKYTQRGGAVALTVKVVDGYAEIAVSDDGAGLTPVACSAIFDMFTQIDATSHMGQGGLAIGLSLVRTLVDLHGGTVVATSAGLGKGSCFTVRLPIGVATALKAADAVPGSLSDLGSSAAKIPGTVHISPLSRSIARY